MLSKIMTELSTNDTPHKSSLFNVATLIGFDTKRNAILSYDDFTLQALNLIGSLCELKKEHIGKRVLISIINKKQICIMGVLHDTTVKNNLKKPFEFKWGETKMMLMDNSIELRCGKSLIRLSNNGEIKIRGDKILTQATQSNDIKGASIKLN